MSKVFEALQRAEKDSSPQRTPKVLIPVPGEDSTAVSGLPQELASLGSAVSEAKLRAGGLSPWLFVCHGHHPHLVEQIKRLRTHLLYSSPAGREPRVILVTSAGSGEGKSLVAANLAASIAQGMSEAAVLADADLRHPTLHKLFGMEVSPGLSDHLAGHAQLQDLLRDTGIPKLRLLAAGSRTEKPIELISSERMKDVIREVRSWGPEQFLVLDTTPVLVTSEPRVLSLEADAVVLVVRHDHTPRGALKEALSLLGNEKVAALVFNDAPRESLKLYGHAYGSYYHDGDYGQRRKGGRKRNKG
ncbi:MAG: hypothetical protein ACUVS3_09875 [Thermodesulfobacteriota bacterium]